MIVLVGVFIGLLGGVVAGWGVREVLLVIGGIVVLGVVQDIKVDWLSYFNYIYLDSVGLLLTGLRIIVGA